MATELEKLFITETIFPGIRIRIINAIYNGNPCAEKIAS